MTAARTIAACAILPLCFILGSSAADKPGKTPPTPASPLVERVRSEVVLIEVHVTDLKGRPVPGLTMDDFHVFIDSAAAPHPLASIEYLGTTPSIEPSAQVCIESREPTGPATPLAAADTLAARTRRFLLFFEDATSSPVNMTAARRAAETFVSQSGSAADQFALASYNDRTGLRILHEFTSDRAALIEALRISLHDTSRFSDLESSQFIQPQRKNDPISQHLKALNSGNMAREDYSQVRRVVDALRVLSDGLASWPGYKSIIFMGDGIPENPGDLHGDPDPLKSLVPDLAKLTTAVAAADVTVHSVQTGGLTAGTREQESSSLYKARGLTALALNTGGLNLRSNNLFGALSDVERSSQGDYILGFVPDGPPDGKYHSINLKMARQDLQVHYRRGFVRLQPQEARERLLQAAFHAPELHPDLGVEVAAVRGPVGPSERTVDLLIYVPPGKVLALPQPGGPVARLEIGITNLDRSGHQTFQTSGHMDVTYGRDPGAGAGSLGLNFFTRVQLPLTAQTVTAVIADLQGETVGAARLALEAVAPAPAEPAEVVPASSHGGAPAISSGSVLGLALYSAQQSSLWIETPSATPGKKESSGVTPTQIGPALKTRFAPDEKITCGFRLASPRPPDAPPLQVAIVQGDRTLSAALIDLRSSGAGAGGHEDGRVKTPLSLAGLAPGDYAVVVREMRPEGPIDIGRSAFQVSGPVADATL